MMDNSLAHPRIKELVAYIHDEQQVRKYTGHTALMHDIRVAELASSFVNPEFKSITYSVGLHHDVPEDISKERGLEVMLDEYNELITQFQDTRFEQIVRMSFVLNKYYQEPLLLSELISDEKKTELYTRAICSYIQDETYSFLKQGANVIIPLVKSADFYVNFNEDFQEGILIQRYLKENHQDDTYVDRDIKALKKIYEKLKIRNAKRIYDFFPLLSQYLQQDKQGILLRKEFCEFQKEVVLEAKSFLKEKKVI